MQLSGTGASPPTDTLSPSSLNFSGTIVGASSLAQTVTLTNSGGVPLTSIATSASGPFQVIKQLQDAARGRFKLFRQRGFRAGRGGHADRNADRFGLAEDANGAACRNGPAAPRDRSEPRESDFSSAAGGRRQCALDTDDQQRRRSADGNVGFQFTGTSATSFSTGTSTCGAVLNSGSSCTAQVIFTPAAWRERSHADGLFFDAGSEGCDGSAKRHGNRGVRPER